MNKLIIGCGYLGQRVAKSWLADGHTVWALTRSATRAEWLASEGIRPIVGDVCLPHTLAGLPTAQTTLYAVGYDRSSGNTQHEVAVIGLRNVLQSIGTDPGRVISISSTSVYGQSDGEWVDEQSDCHPVQPGGACCAAGEEVIRSFSESSSATVNVLRLSGIYGPGRLLSRIESVRAAKVIPGRADAWLNLIHVDDAVSAVRACEERGQRGQTYLISDDLPVRRRDYYGLLSKLTDSPAPTFDAELSAKRGSGGLNKRCRNTRMHADLKVELAYPTFNEGLPQSLGAAPG